jgi:hypothetical protein
MLEYQGISGSHLIVVPKSTLSNWMNEIARWAPTLKAIRFHGDKAMREEIIRTQLEPVQRDENRQWHVCVTTYEICNIEKSVLGKFAWNYFIIDEAHRLKNEASSFSKTVRAFETRFRLLLTGGLHFKTHVMSYGRFSTFWSRMYSRVRTSSSKCILTRCVCERVGKLVPRKLTLLSPLRILPSVL